MFPAPGALSSSGRAFQSTTDPKLLWRAGQFGDVLNALAAAVSRGEGPMVLVGDVGTGKTIVTAALVESLGGQGVRVGMISYPRLEPLEFHVAIANAYDLPAELPTSDAFVEQFTRFLNDARSQKQRVLLVVDEAQGLSSELFREIARLLRAGADPLDGVGVFNVLLVGGSDLEAILSEPANLVLGRLIQVRCRLRALTVDEVVAYGRDRLTGAGLDPDLISVEAFREVAAVSGGVPRLINTICHRALVVAHLSRMPTIDVALIRKCVEKIDASGRARRTRPVAVELNDIRLSRVGGRRTRPAVVLICLGFVLALAVAGYTYRLRGEVRGPAAPAQAVVPAPSEAPARPAGQQAPPGIVEPAAAGVRTEPSEAPRVTIPGASRPPVEVPRALAPAAPAPPLETPRALTPASPRPPTEAARPPAGELTPPARPPVVIPRQMPRPTKVPPDATVETAREPRAPARPVEERPVVAPRRPAPVERRPVETSTGGDQNDPGAIIDWLLERTPRGKE